MLDLSLVLSSRFELTTLSRKAAVGFSLHFNEKFALLGGITAAQWERTLYSKKVDLEQEYKTGRGIFMNLSVNLLNFVSN